jgi:ABC-type uncharacterized transport system permease subunit
LGVYDLKISHLVKKKKKVSILILNLVATYSIRILISQLEQSKPNKRIADVDKESTKLTVTFPSKIRVPNFEPSLNNGGGGAITNSQSRFRKITQKKTQRKI